MLEHSKLKIKKMFALGKAFGISFAVAGFLKFVSDLLNFVGPQVLKSVTFFYYIILFYNITTGG